MERNLFAGFFHCVKIWAGVYMIKSYKTRFQKFSALLSNPKIAKYARQNENYAFISCYYFILFITQIQSQT